MDHLSLVVFFLSFSSWLVGLGVSLSFRGRETGELARQFRRFCMIFLFYTLQNLVFVYLDNLHGDSLAPWINRLQQSFEVLAFSAITGQLPLLAAVFFDSRDFPSFRKLAFPLVSALSVTALILLQFQEEWTFAFLLGFGLPLFAALVAFAVVGVVVLLRAFHHREGRFVPLLFAGLCFLAFLGIAEDYLIAVFDEVILSPYLLFFFNLFFIGFILRSHGSSTELGDSTDSPSFLQTVKRGYGISTREYEVLLLLIRGCGKAEIAEELFISDNTVKTHTSSIYRKLGVSSRFELMNLAHKTDSPTPKGEA